MQAVSKTYLKLALSSIAFMLLSTKLEGALPAEIKVDAFSTLDFINSSSAANTLIKVTNNSVVTFEDLSTAGNAQFSGSTATINFNQPTGDHFTGQLATTISTVNKNGAGKLYFTGDNTPFGDNTFVNQGTLVLNNFLGGNVNDSATLAGNGTVLGNVNVAAGAAIAPGDGNIATLSMLGNYTQSSSSIYDVLLSTAGSASLINIGGTASLGGIVNAASIDGNFAVHRTYRILHADGGLGGTTYDGGLVINPALQLFLTYDLNNVYLTFIQNFAALGATPNQINVANQLDSITDPTADQALILDALADLSVPQLQQALDDLAGEQYTFLIQEGAEISRRFASMLYDSFRNLLDPCDPCEKRVCGGERISWVSADSGVGNIRGDINAKGLKSNNYGISLGILQWFNPSFFLGAALNYDHDHLRFDQGGKNSIESGQGAIYGAFRQPSYYLFSDLILGRSFCRFNRSIEFGSISRIARSKPKISQGALYAEYGVNWNFCKVLIQPFIGGELDYCRVGRVAEDGAGSANLEIGSKSSTYAQSYLGAHFLAKKAFFGKWCADLAWKHRFGSKRQSIDVAFTEFGQPFPIIGSKESRDGLCAALYLSAYPRECVEIYGRISGEYWNQSSNLELAAGLSFWW